MSPTEPAPAPLRAPSVERALQATSPVLLTFRVEPDGRRSMPYAAQAIVDIYGLSPGLLRDDATPALELIHPDDAAAVSATIDESARSLTPWECTFRVRHPAKGILWIEGRSIPAKEPDGAVVWHGFIHDVTARLEAETALRESEMKFRELAETIEDVFWLTDPSKTKLEYISPAYERVWGRSCESLYQDPMQWLEAIHPDDRARIQAAAVAQAVNSYDVEYRIVVPDGSVRWVRDRAFPVYDEAGAIVRIAGLAQDVTEKRGLEEQLRLTQRMESIGRLAGGVAHDFNNLLTVISACSEEVVASLPPGSPQHEALCEVRVAVDRAAGLTRDLLAFSRREVLTPQALELNVVVTDTQRMLRRILGENIDLVTSLDPGAGWVFVDPGHWSSVVLNLAVNARDAMTKGGTLTIATRHVDVDAAHAQARPHLAKGRYAVLEVSDTGCGFPPEVAERVFEPFFTTKPKGQGTGLGLAVVHGIVQQSGGCIEVASVPGVGTTFRVHLPITDRRSALDRPAARPAASPGLATILLVEDEEGLRRALRRGLESRFRVVVAPDAEAALAILDRGEVAFDLLLTDLVLPKMDGRRLAEEAAQRDPKMKVLFTTGYTDDEVVRYGVSREEVSLLRKPFTIQALVDKVREVLAG